MRKGQYRLYGTGVAYFENTEREREGERERERDE